MRLLAILLVLLACDIAHASPAADQVAGYRALVDQDLRLATVGYRMASANTPFCKTRERNPGWVLHDELQYPDRETARAAFGFLMPVAVAAVVPGGPADKQGVKPGDALVAINGTRLNLQDRRNQKATAERIETIQEALRQAMVAAGPVKLAFETANGPKLILLDPPAICASRFWVDTRSNLDAGADGDGVRITEGLMTFTANDDAELSATVAHELSHNLLRHRERLNKVNRRIKEILATEIEADRLSVWLMANAGYDPTAALRFAARFGRKTGLGIFSEGTHLRWKNRIKVMQAEIALMADARKQDGLLPPPLLIDDQLLRR